MKISLVDLDDDTAIDLEVDPHFPVGSIKCQYLTSREHEKPMQTILFTFKNELLEDNHTLDDYNIQSSSAIMVEYVTVLQSKANLQEKKLKIYVKLLDGEKMRLLTHTNTVIIEVKEVIYKTQGIPLRQQRLISAGKQLEDDRTLADYGIKEGQLIYLIPRLLGS